MTMPNFLILGAAKAGTTSLYAYLRQHPQIYLPRIKEPNFFAYGEAPFDRQGPGAEIIRRNAIMTPAHYAQLFAGVTQETAIGEASVTNLLPRACERIHHYVPDAKLIVLLRQPADRAYSHFLHHWRLGLEPLADFAAALADEPKRLRERWPLTFCYQRISHYTADLQQYLGAFSREQLRIYLYEDLATRPQQLLQEIFAFLGVDETFAPDVSVRYNVARLPRLPWLQCFLRHPHWLKGWLRLCLPGGWRKRLVAKIERANWQPPPALAPVLRAEITRSFQGEIIRLQQILARDLSHWLAPTGRLSSTK
ncbi:MAG: sulfotransferase [Caldilineaceae bacterium]